MANTAGAIASACFAHGVALGALAWSVAAAQTGGGVYTSTGTMAGKFDKTAPAVAIEDVRALRQRGSAKSVEAMTSYRKASDACYERGAVDPAVQGRPAVTAGIAGMPPPVDMSALNALQQEGQALRARSEVLERREREVAQIPGGNAREAALKTLRKDQEEHERAEEALQEKQRSVMTQVTAGSPGMTLGVVAAPPGPLGADMARAQQRQLLAARDPNVARCLAEVERRHDVRETPALATFQEKHFDVAEQVLRRNSQAVVFLQTEAGLRFNVVSKSGPYSARVVEPEAAMRRSQQVLEALEAAQLVDVGGADAAPVQRPRSERALEILKGLEDAVGNAKR